MKKILLVVIFVTFLIGCNDVLNTNSESDDNRSIIESLEGRVEEVENEIEEQNSKNTALNIELEEVRNKVSVLNREIEKYKKNVEALIYEKENFGNLSSLTLEFSRARTSGDIDSLKSLVSNNIILFNKDDEIWARFKDDDNGYGYPLYNSRREKSYEDMHIVYFEYDSDEETFMILNEEHFDVEDGATSGIGFIYLYFIRENDIWKIDRFEKDA